MIIKFYIKISLFIVFIFPLFTMDIKAETNIKGEIIAGGIVIVETRPGAIVKLDGEIIPISDQGYGLVGFERQPKNTQNLKIIHSTDEIENITLNIKKRSYKIQRIEGLQKEKVEPPKALLDRIYEERLRVKKSRLEAGLLKTPYYLNGIIMPANGPITGIYGSQRILNGISKSPHYGLDIALSVGHSVLAPMDGVVVFTDSDLFYSGGTIIISHGQALTTSYLHLSKILVKNNQKVLKGEIIGEVGATGRVTGAHLHWGAEWMGKRIDPEYLLRLLK